MANKYEYEDRSDGIAITRMVTTDKDIVIPDTMDGRTVVELCDRFLVCSANGDNRRITIPGSVRRFGKEAFHGAMRVDTIVTEGDVNDIFSVKMIAEYDFTLCFTYDGRKRSFGFVSGYPVSFPEFDTAILSSGFNISVDVAMARLSDPVMLSEKDREGYLKYMRSRIIPMAERTVAENDPDRLKELCSAGVLGIDDMHSLLRRSVRSGRTSMTSVIMSIIGSMHRK